MNELSQQTINHFKRIAKRQTIDDMGTEEEPYYPSEVYGGNCDDAYMGGHEDGETSTARMILNELNISWEE